MNTIIESLGLGLLEVTIAAVVIGITFYITRDRE